MRFIGQHPSSPDWPANVLTDGRSSCRYEDLPALFSRWDEAFAQQGIDRGECLALACENSLPCALVVLYLLERSASFLLFPQAQGAVQPLPSFCRYRLTMNGWDPSDPIASLRFEQSGSGHSIQGSPQLFVRTSSSTGAAKLVAHSQAKLRGNGLNCVERLELKSTDRIALPVPIFHMFGLGAAFLPGVAVGAALDLQAGANLLGYIERERIFNPNVAFMTPIFGETLLKGRRSARPYRLTVMAGDRLRNDSFDRYEDRFGGLVQLYGSTEMGAIAVSSPQDSRELRKQTVGKPLSQVVMRLERNGPEVDTDDATGELLCLHAYGFTGYVDEDGRPVPHAERAGWYATRDLGNILPDGRVQVLGRADHSVNRSGLLVLFADVEKALCAIEGVETATVVSRGESHYGKRLVAFCVVARASALTASDIRSACFARLPRRAIPDAVRVLPSLPLLPNGKVDRQRLNHLAGETYADLA